MRGLRSAFILFALVALACVGCGSDDDDAAKEAASSNIVTEPGKEGVLTEEGP